MRQIVLLASCLSAVLFPVLADNVERVVYVSTDGVRYFWNVTAAGVVFVAPEADPDDQFLLTPDCGVRHQTFGKGSWGFDDGGWQISFGLQWQEYFPGPLPPVDHSNCMMLR
jgi:hypothetical protein